MTVLAKASNNLPEQSTEIDCQDSHDSNSGDRKIMVMVPKTPGTKNDSAGEDQQQFIWNRHTGCSVI
jgi:hypothetical protein